MEYITIKASVLESAQQAMLRSEQAMLNAMAAIKLLREQLASAQAELEALKATCKAMHHRD